MASLAVVAAKALPYYAEKAKERQKDGQERGRQSQKGISADLHETISAGTSTDQAGADFGVSGRTLAVSILDPEKREPRKTLPDPRGLRVSG